MLDPHVYGAPVLLRHLPEGPLVGCEVGVLRGVNAAALLDARPDLLLYLVDNWNHGGLVPESPAEIRREARARLAPYGHRVIWHETHSLAAAVTFQSRSLDFVYLDSCHEAPHVSQEIEEWWHTVKSGGILAGHDYGHPDFPGVKTAVDFKSREYGWAVTVEDRTWMVQWGS